MKILNYILPTDALNSILNYLEQKFTLSIENTTLFALFKNGVELPATRQTIQKPAFNTDIYNLVGVANVQLNIGDVLELRAVLSTGELTANQLTSPANLIINKVG